MHPASGAQAAASIRERVISILQREEWDARPRGKCAIDAPTAGRSDRPEKRRAAGHKTKGRMGTGTGQKRLCGNGIDRDAHSPVREAGSKVVFPLPVVRARSPVITVKKNPHWFAAFPAACGRQATD